MNSYVDDLLTVGKFLYDRFFGFFRERLNGINAGLHILK